MKDLEIIILAAGKGTRMNSDKPKVLTEINDRPMLSYLLDTLKKIRKEPLLVLGYKADEVKKIFGKNHRYVLQEQQLGTGHAVHEAISDVSPLSKYVMVLYGDQPLINEQTIEKLYESHKKQKRSPVTLGTVVVDDFCDWRKNFFDFGRIIRNDKNKIEKIIEKKDATTSELEIKELNPSYFCFNFKWLIKNITKIGKKNVQGEYYLTDIIGIAKNQGFELNSIIIPAHEALGVNSIEQLEHIKKFIKK